MNEFVSAFSTHAHEKLKKGDASQKDGEDEEEEEWRGPTQVKEAEDDLKMERLAMESRRMVQKETVREFMIGKSQIAFDQLVDVLIDEVGEDIKNSQDND